jgi:2-oxoglutarate ferredoxin oxidoreductase subunit delta
LCVNCHYCEAICPDFAIYSLEAPAQRISELSIQ